MVFIVLDLFCEFCLRSGFLMFVNVCYCFFSVSVVFFGVFHWFFKGFFNVFNHYLERKYPYYDEFVGFGLFHHI